MYIVVGKKILSDYIKQNLQNFDNFKVLFRPKMVEIVWNLCDVSFIPIMCENFNKMTNAKT